MSGLLEYSGIATKIRAMRSKLLKREDYEKMSEKSSLSEVLTYLMGIEAYAKVLSTEIAPGTLDRSSIERTLYKTVYNDYDKLYRFSGKSPRNYLDLYIMKHEVSFIKMCFRNLYGTKGSKEININLYKGFFDKRSNINVTLLYESGSISELIGNLTKTGYYSSLKLLKDNPNVTLFDYESLLDIFLFKTTWNICCEEMPRADRKILKEIYGEQIDLLNLLWIDRSRKYYKFTEMQLFNLLIPIYYKVKKRDLINLIRAESDEEYNKLLSNTYYTERLKDAESINLEKIYDDTIDQLYQSSLKNSPYSIACVANYMYVKEKEVEDIVKLIEFVGYNRGKDFISYKYKEGVIG